jgi:LysM repeat protein
MAVHQWRTPLARYGAPAAFLVAATAAALLIRAGLKGGDPKATPSKTATTLTDTFPHPGKPAYYRVRSGDTLGGVAERFHTSVDILRSLNPRVDPNSLQLGQKLRVR